MDWFLYDNSHRHTSFFLVTQFFVQNLSSLLREIYSHRYCVKIFYFSLLHNLGTFSVGYCNVCEEKTHYIAIYLMKMSKVLIVY